MSKECIKWMSVCTGVLGTDDKDQYLAVTSEQLMFKECCLILEVRSATGHSSSLGVSQHRS